MPPKRTDNHDSPPTSADYALGQLSDIHGFPLTMRFKRANEEQTVQDLGSIRTTTPNLKQCVDNLNKEVGAPKQNAPSANKYSLNRLEVIQYNLHARSENADITSETRRYMALTPLFSPNTGKEIENFPRTVKDFFELDDTELARLIKELQSRDIPEEDFRMLREIFRNAIGLPYMEEAVGLADFLDQRISGPWSKPMRLP